MISLKCPVCNLARLPNIFICRKCGLDFANRLIIHIDSNRYLNGFIKSYLKPENLDAQVAQIARFCNPGRRNYFDEFFDTVYVISEEERAKNEQSKILKIMFTDAVKDSSISDEKFNLITSFYAESSLTEDEYKEICETIYKNCVRLLASNGSFRLLEAQKLDELAERLNVSSELRNRMRKRVDYLAGVFKFENAPD